MWMFVASVTLALSVSAACSLMEAALLSLSATQVAQISARRPRIGAIWQRFKTNIERPIAAILILNTSAHTIGATISGSAFDSLFGRQWVLVFSLVFTYAMLQFTEVLPKTIGVRYNREVAVLTAGPLNMLVRGLRPLLAAIAWINRPFEGKRGKGAGQVTVEEVAALASMARMANQITSHQEQIIRGAMRLSRQCVRDVMIPVEHVGFLSTSMTIADALLMAYREAHTRSPVCRDGNVDDVVGYINFKELVYYNRRHPDDSRLDGVIRPLHEARLDDSAAELLRLFIDQHIHIAIVRGDQGKTLGIVALEDLVEELVGEIEDEFDRLPRMLHPLIGGNWMVGGGVPVSELNARLGAALEMPHETVSAWLERHLDHPPRPGDVFRANGLRFRVRRIRRGHVFEVMVTPDRTPKPPPHPTAAPA